MQRLFGRTVFAVSKTDYRWEDVVLAAILWNEWAGVAERARVGIALSRLADEDPLSEAVDAAAAEFRYARDLVSARETEAWLARWGLDVESWTAWIRADLLRRRHGDEPVPADEQAAPEVVSEAVFTEALCSGALEGFARRLAGRAAAFASLHESDAQGGVEPAPEPSDLSKLLPFLLIEEGLPGLSLAASRERAALVVRLERAFNRFERSVVTATAVAERVRARRAEWTQVAVRMLLLPREEMAREAILSVREDGLSLEQVARDARAAVEERVVFVDDLPLGIRNAFFAARKGELLGPLLWDNGFAVVLVLEKTLPSALDEAVAKRARADLLDSLVSREIDARVTWRTSP